MPRSRKQPLVRLPVPPLSSLQGAAPQGGMWARLSLVVSVFAVFATSGAQHPTYNLQLFYNIYNIYNIVFTLNPLPCPHTFISPT